MMFLDVKEQFLLHAQMPSIHCWCSDLCSRGNTQVADALLFVSHYSNQVMSKQLALYAAEVHAIHPCLLLSSHSVYIVD
jgi:hypothetical protein